MSDYLTKEEVAEFLGVSTRTVHRWIMSGALPAYKMGPTLVRIKRDDLASFITPMETK